MVDTAVSALAHDVSQSHELAPLCPATSRSHRGRPAGSKNEPKQPIVIARETPGLLRAHALDVAPGCDVLVHVANLSRRLRRSVCVLSGCGCVSNVTLQQVSANSSVTFHGRFEILSLMGTFLPTGTAVTGLTVFLSGAQGLTVGGKVEGSLVASGRVVVMVASFSNASFERLPMATEEEGRVLCNGHMKRIDGVVHRSVKLEYGGGYGDVLSGVIAGGTFPMDLRAWLAAERQLGKK